MSRTDTIPELAAAWLAEGRRVALATVVETWGSAPRPAGAQLVIDGEGAFEGSVSGGCVEGAVVLEALEALADGRARLLEFGVADEDAFTAGLACGGNIRVLVEPVDGAEGPARDEIDRLVAARAARRPVVLSVNLATHERRLAEGGDVAAHPGLVEGIAAVDGDWFTIPHVPPLRLLVVGAAHIAQALVPMARLLGHDVTLIDPREAFASPARFPGVEISHYYADEAMARLGCDARTAVVTLAHDPKIDDPALIAGLRGGAYYVGALGSRRTHAKRVERLVEIGFTEDEIARIDAPVGLDIGAKTPAEIAVSIAGALVAALRSGAG
jgi:xanthine dehydrogenase accessory factor